MWCGEFYAADTSTMPKTDTHYVRAVRGDALDTGIFFDNCDGTVTDLRTGLVWQKETSGPVMTLDDAINDCEDLSFAGFDDWRLPNKNELMSLVNFDQESPAIDTTFFSDTYSDKYWTSTTFSGDEPGVWQVHFKNGQLEYSSDAAYLRAVRGGQ